MDQQNKRQQGGQPGDKPRQAPGSGENNPSAQQQQGGTAPAQSGGERSSSGSNYGDWSPNRPAPGGQPGSHDAGSTISGAAAGSSGAPDDQRKGAGSAPLPGAPKTQGQPAKGTPRKDSP